MRLYHLAMRHTPKLPKRSIDERSQASLQLFARWLLVVFIALRLFSIFAQWPAFAGGDSVSYRPLVPQPPELNYFKYWPETLNGGSFRSILPVGFFHLFPNDGARMVAQSIVSLICWAFLISRVATWASELNTFKVTKVMLPLIVTILGLTPLITSWNKIIYSESLAFSVTCVLFGMLMESLKPNQRLSVTNSIVYSMLIFLLVTARPNLIIFGLFFSLSLCLIAIKSNRKKATALIVIALLAISNVASLYYLNLQDKTWSKSISRELTTISYYASQDNVNATTFIQVLNADRSRPSCIAPLAAPLESGKEMLWGMNFGELGKGYCPDAVKWGSKSATKLLVTWMVKYPKEALVTYRYALIESTRFADYFGMITPLPAPLIEMIYPQTDGQIALWDKLDQGPSREPHRSFDPIFLYLSILITTPFILRERSNGIRKLPKIKSLFHSSSVAGLIFLGALGSLLIGIITIPGPQGEVYRMGVIPWAILRIMILMSLTYQAPNFFLILQNSKASAQ